MPTWIRSHFDDFSRSDSSTIGNGWALVGGAGKFAIASGKLAVAGTADFAANQIIRPYTSNPGSLVPGTDEGSVNQRAVVRFPNLTAASTAAILLRASSSGGRGYLLFFFGGSLFISPVVGGSRGSTSINSGALTYLATSGGAAVDPLEVDFSVVSTDSTHTTISVTITDLYTNQPVYANTIVDTTAGLQSGDLSGGAAVAISGFPGGGGTGTILSVAGYTDQAVSASPTLVPGTITAGTIGPNSVKLSATVATGGNGTISYRWFRATADPASTGSYGVARPGLTSGTAAKDTGLRCSTGYWLSLRATDQTTYCPQVAWSTIHVTTAAGATGNPGTFALGDWLDAAQLEGQSDGSAMTGYLGPAYPKAAPTYRASGHPSGEPALEFDATKCLEVAPGAAPDLDATVAGASTWFVVYATKFAGANTTNTLFRKGTTYDRVGLAVDYAQGPDLLFARPYNADSYGSTHKATIAPHYDAAYPQPVGNPLVYETCGAAILVVTVDGSGNVRARANNREWASYPGGNPLPGLDWAAPWSIGHLVDASNDTVINGFGFTGKLFSAGAIAGVLTDSQVEDLTDYFAGRFGGAAAKVPVVTKGDSRTAGYDGSGGPGTTSTYTNFPIAAQLQTALDAARPGVFACRNRGHVGARTGQFAVDGQQYSQMRYGPNALEVDRRKAVVFLIGPMGVNDYSNRSGGPGDGLGQDATTAAGNLVAGVAALESLRDAGTWPWDARFVASTELDYQDGEAGWLTYRATEDAAIVAGLPAVAGKRALADLAADSRVGAAGASANLTYYDGDQLHMRGQDGSGNPGGGYGVVASLDAPKVLAVMSASGPFPTFLCGFSGGFPGLVGNFKG